MYFQRSILHVLPKFNITYKGKYYLQRSILLTKVNIACISKGQGLSNFKAAHGLALPMSGPDGVRVAWGII